MDSEGDGEFDWLIVAVDDKLRDGELLTLMVGVEEADPTGMLSDISTHSDISGYPPVPEDTDRTISRNMLKGVVEVVTNSLIVPVDQFEMPLLVSTLVQVVPSLEPAMMKVAAP